MDGFKLVAKHTFTERYNPDLGTFMDGYESRDRNIIAQTIDWVCDTYPEFEEKIRGEVVNIQEK